MGKAFLLGSIIILLASIISAQNKSNDFNSSLTSSNYSKPNQVNFSGCEGGQYRTTTLDFPGNFCLPSRIDLADIDNDGKLEPLIVGYYVSSLPVTLYYCDGTDFNSIELTNEYFSWEGSIQYCSSGPLAGKALVFINSLNATSAPVSILAQVDVTTLQVTRIDSTFNKFFHAFYYAPSGNIWAIEDDELAIYKSTDLGASFNYYKSIGEGDPNFGTPQIPWSYTLIAGSNNGQYLSFLGIFKGASLSGNPDGVYWYHSSDAGESWLGEFVAKASEYGQVVNRDYAPYFTAWKDGDLVVDNLGVTHLAVNGFGEGLLTGETDTTEVHPMLYWNSRDKQWIAISDPVFEAPDDGGHEAMGYCPGLAIPQSYPSISVDNDGNTVVVAWTTVEFEGTPGISPYNLYNSFNEFPFYYTDLVYNISFDGGATFYHEIQYLKSETDVEELYSNLSPEIEVEDGTPYFHYIYFIDPIPGCALFGENSESDCYWYYDKQAALIVSVENENGVPVENFKLEQNYPNPFNPVTRIQYMVESPQLVTLKVYDLLGNEITTLVNEQKTPGVYEVEFQSTTADQQLASGIYFYQLRAGSFVETTKMILMK